MLPVLLTGTLSIQLSDELSFGPEAVGAAVAVYWTTVAVSSIHMGRAVDRIGGTRSVRIGALTSAIAAFSVAIIGRTWLALAACLVLAGAANAITQPASNRLLVGAIASRRLGTAFGIKQSAAPLGSMLAGLAVPVGIAVGWRWAFVFAGILASVLAVSAGTPAPAGVRARSPRRSAQPLRNRLAIVILVLAFGISVMATTSILAFYVDAAVIAGASQGSAGLLFGAASVAAIATRLITGALCDRLDVRPLNLCAGMLVIGAGGLGLMALARPWSMALGVMVGLSGTWGFPGVFWLAVMRAYPDSPGRASGAFAPGTLGGTAGPLIFAQLAGRWSYPTAWACAAAVTLVAAVGMALGAARLRSGEVAHAVVEV